MPLPFTNLRLHAGKRLRVRGIGCQVDQLMRVGFQVIEFEFGSMKQRVGVTLPIALHVIVEYGLPR